MRSLTRAASARLTTTHRAPTLTPTTRPSPAQVLEGKPGSTKFALHVRAGEFSDSQIVVMLGENGTGKTTFIRMLAGLLKPDCAPGAKQVELAGFSVSYKPQKIAPSFEGSVRALLMTKIKEAYAHPQVRGALMCGVRGGGENARFLCSNSTMRLTPTTPHRSNPPTPTPSSSLAATCSSR